MIVNRNAAFGGNPEHLPNQAGVFELTEQTSNNRAVAHMAFVRCRERAVEIQIDRVRIASDQQSSHTPDTQDARCGGAGRTGHDRSNGIEEAWQSVCTAAITVDARAASAAIRHGYSSKMT